MSAILFVAFVLVALVSLFYLMTTQRTIWVVTTVGAIVGMVTLAVWTGLNPATPQAGAASFIGPEIIIALMVVSSATIIFGIGYMLFTGIRAMIPSK